MQALDDVTIISIEQYGAGPWATMHLADLGADIIKIENPATGGDVGRYVPPFQHGEDSLFFQALNRNKRSIDLDLGCAAGREVFVDLVAASDGVFANVRGDVPERLGLRYEDLHAVNEQIVCCILSAFGMTGPRRDEPGYDYMIQGLAGWMSVTGDPQGAPQRVGLSLVDFSTGLTAALALLAGIHAARRSGIGGDCDISLFDTAIGMLNYPAAWHLNAGFEPGRTASSAHPSLVPFQMFETADEPIIVACAKEKFWIAFADVIGHPELTRDPRFIDFAARHEHRDALLPMLEAVLATRTADEWLALFASSKVPASPVNTVASALCDPQVEARGLIVETQHPQLGTVRQIAAPIELGRQRIQHRRAPLRGEHTRDVLGTLLGYDVQTIDRLRTRGAFGLASEGSVPT